MTALACVFLALGTAGCKPASPAIYPQYTVTDNIILLKEVDLQQSTSFTFCNIVKSDSDYFIMKEGQTMKKKRIEIILVVCGCLCMIIVLLFWYGVLLFNGRAALEYPIRGVDVSSYQGDINWEVMAEQNIQFAFIKATEGSSFVDPYFKHNFTEAQKTHLRIGFYHFFSYDSQGMTQAENFIATVPKISDMLPPVIDIEFYGDKEKNLPDKNKAQQELHAMIDLLYEHYGKMPILYATEKSYRLYIANEFENCDIWIRNVFFEPSLDDKRSWTFWQYTDRMRLDGYTGKEPFIDMNVFWGSQEELDAYAQEP
jgi:lysozyme